LRVAKLRKIVAGTTGKESATLSLPRLTFRPMFDTRLRFSDLTTAALLKQHLSTLVLTALGNVRIGGARSRGWRTRRGVPQFARWAIIVKMIWTMERRKLANVFDYEPKL